MIHVMVHLTKPTVSLSEARFRTDKVLQTFFAEYDATALQMDSSYAQLWRIMARLNQAGGKRLRPYMTQLSYSIFKGTHDDVIVEPSIAWELLHLCLLIHDDIIDNDFIRYGVDNVAGSYQKMYLPLESSEDRRNHLASSAAILAGDMALSAAHSMILDSMLTSDQKVTALRYVTKATFTVAGGELLDSESVLGNILDTDTAKIATFKTASYTFVGPLLMGADLAGATKEQLTILDSFATELGRAYQLADDLIGVFGDSKVTGKSTSGDIREGKHTYLMQYAFGHANSDEVAVLQSLVGKASIEPNEVERVAEILLSSGARQAVEERMQQHVAACERMISELQITCPKADDLAVLISMATKRQF